MYGTMNWHLLALVGTLLTTGTALNTVLNVDEITSVHYAIDIQEQPVSKEQKFDGDMITVVNKHGQEFVCSLPKIVPSDTESKGEEHILDQLVDISGLLKPMETAPCLIKTVDWWTYEFCYGSVIKQYHLEDNKASGPILILGKYESEYNWKNSSETKNRLQRFHSQFYVNGTKCDLTGEPRRTEVRFHCEEGVGDYIQRVDEPESCRYVVTVATIRVCHHPYLRLQAVRRPHPITCSPMISEEQYQKYLAYRERKTKEEENRKKKWLKQNAELLGESADDESQSSLEPVSTDSSEDEDDDELKMSIKIFRLYPVKKQANAQAAEAKEDVMGLETHITLEEDETEASGTGAAVSEEETDINKITDNESNSGELSSSEKMQMTNVDGDETQMVDDEDDDDEDDDGDGSDDIDTKEKVLTQASKSTNRDHFSKLLRRLKQLGNMFMNQEADENAIPGGDDRISELQNVVDSIKVDHIKQLEQEVKEWTKKLNKDTIVKEIVAEHKDILFSLKQNIMKINEKYINWTKKKKKELLEDADGKEEDLEEEEQRLGTSLNSLLDALDKAENKLSIAKKEMETLEEFLGSQLKEMEHTATETEEESGTQDRLEWDYQDPTEGMSQNPENQQANLEATKQEDSTSHLESKTKPKRHSSSSTTVLSDNLTGRNRYPSSNLAKVLKHSQRKLPRTNVIQGAGKDSESKSTVKNADKKTVGTQQLNILKNKVEDESQKSKLEQTIKDRLQKLGLERLGRKFEVKILTPNSMEEEDNSNLLLSQEETEAFQNMIVNLLSANAEELEERERHRKLEKNYDFKFEEPEEE